MLSAVVVMLEMLNVLLDVNVFCLAPTAADIRVVMSVPFKYTGPVMRALLPHMTLPLTSKDGILMAQLKVALLLVSPSRSMLFESAKLSVPDAGLIRAHVRVPNVTEDELDTTPCFAANCADRSVTSEMAIGPVDAEKSLNRSRTLIPLTVNWPVIAHPLLDRKSVV